MKQLFSRVFSTFAYGVLVLISLGILGTLLLTAWVMPEIPRLPSDLNHLVSLPPTEVYASDGSLLVQIGGRKAVPLQRMAPMYVRAVLAAEDDQFYEHEGIDKPATMKALVFNLLGRSSRGGSTITQQLAKNLFFTFEKTYTRKFKEILTALEIERRFSKDAILAAYCNGINFGPYAYGIEEAATSYFGKHAANLTLAESALLAGLPQSPSRYNPYRHPERAIERQRWVLRRMLSLGWISEKEYRRALDEELAFQPLYASVDEGRYYLDAVLSEVEQEYGENVLYYGGLKIYTTLDPRLQAIAVEGVGKGLADLDERLGLETFARVEKEKRQDYPQASLVAVECATGAVKALVGGRDWQATQYNRVLKSTRNLGSVVKPILYLTAIERLGIHPATLVKDSSIVVSIPGSRAWRPTNFDRRFHGQMVLKAALEQSLNVVAARLILRVGPEAMVSTMGRFGIDREITPHYSIALGAVHLTPLELAAVGGSIANMGEVVTPFLIRRIEDRSGNILREHLVRRTPTFDPDDTYLLADMMQGVRLEGTARGLSRYGFDLPAIAKTGTTNDYRDAWFLGATPRLAAVTWVGYDDYRTMRDPSGRGITGASGAMPLWAYFMIEATEGEPPREFPVPPTVSFETVHRQYGWPVSGDNPDGIRCAVPIGAELPDISLISTSPRQHRSGGGGVP